ncbi:MAG: hypothetical protein HKN79_06545, partial [Flavobacteriales bacterium]|nr:hypothetical protein [Flavobacteriales bacterium]
FEVFGGDFWSSVMENGLTQLSDEVEVEVDIHCRRADYQARYLTEDSTSMVKTILDRIRDGEEIDSIFNSLQDAEGLSSGQMTSIGRTLLAWQMYPEALSLFKKKKELFPENYSIHNDLGITRLLLNDTLLAKKEFEKVLIDEPENSKAYEYLRLIRRMVHE